MNSLFAVASQRKPQWIATLLLLALSCQVSISGLNDYVIQFDTVDREASHQLQMEGVSVTPTWRGLVGTQDGLGLGLNSAGAFGSLDIVYGSQTVRDGWLTLKASGVIDSLTVLPHTTASESDRLYAVLFSWEMRGLFKVVPLDLSDLAPTTIDLAGADRGNGISKLSIGMLSFPQQPLSLNPESSAGFSIQSVQIQSTLSPNLVPEPTSLALFGIGAFALLCKRRRAAFRN